MHGMGNLEKLRGLEKKIDHPEAAAAIREAIEAIESGLVRVRTAKPSETRLDSSHI